MNSKSDAPSEWAELIKLTKGQRILVERIQLPEMSVHIEGKFELPQLAQLTLEDQVFVTAFVRSHGSIKEMEHTFGVSYPTIKSRLSRIAESLEFVDVNPRPLKNEILDRLKRGEITVSEAVAALEEK